MKENILKFNLTSVSLAKTKVKFQTSLISVYLSLFSRQNISFVQFLLIIHKILQIEYSCFQLCPDFCRLGLFSETLWMAIYSAKHLDRAFLFHFFLFSFHPFWVNYLVFCLCSFPSSWMKRQ